MRCTKILPAKWMEERGGGEREQHYSDLRINFFEFRDRNFKCRSARLKFFKPYKNFPYRGKNLSP